MSQSFLSRLPLSRYEIDRDHLGREREDLWDALWADPETRVLPVFQGSGLLAEPNRLALLPVDALPPFDTRVYLGSSVSTTSREPVGTPLVAVELDDARHLAEAEWSNLRQGGHLLSDRDAGLLTEALGILQTLPGGTLQTIGLPLSMDGKRPTYEKGAPALGEHNAEILK